MVVDIFNIKPTTITRDLKNKYILIYSQPKVGKTSFAAQFPKNLLLAFEKGYNAIPGLSVQDIDSWKTFKLVLKQLRDERAKELYDSITIDTVGIAWDLCEKYICSREDVTKLGDIPWGAGYAMCTKEFEESLREITLLGYGIVIISHSEEKPIKQGSEETVIRPAIQKRAYEVVNRIVDIIGYIGVDFDEKGEGVRTLYTRRTPDIIAGSRFRYLPSKIPFGYDEMVDALQKAIEEEQKRGAIVSNERKSQCIEEVNYQYDFSELRAKARDLWEKAKEQEKLNKVYESIEKYFGKRVKLSEIVESQRDMLELVVADMEQLVS